MIGCACVLYFCISAGDIVAVLLSSYPILLSVADACSCNAFLKLFLSSGDLTATAMALHSGRSPQGGGRRYAHVPQCRCRCALATCGRRPSQPQSLLLRKCLLPSCFASFSALFPLLSQGLTSFSIIPTFRNRTVAFLSPGI